MKTDLENRTDNKNTKIVIEDVLKTKYSMLYYFKCRQSHENLLMFVMD